MELAQEAIVCRGIILYRSKYGATRKYANWLKEETGFDCIETNKITMSQLDQYNVIVGRGDLRIWNIRAILS